MSLAGLGPEDRQALAGLAAERFGVEVDEVLDAIEQHLDKISQPSLEQRIEAVGKSPHPDAVRALCAEIAARDPIQHDWLIRKLAKASGLTIKALREAVKAEREKLPEPDPDDDGAGAEPERLVKTLLPDAPANADLVMPRRYGVNQRTGAIARYSEHGAEPVSPAPVLVTRRLLDVDEESVKLELAYRRNGVWRTTTTTRATVADTRKILSLADEDLTVNSDNARELIRYLAAFEQTNISVIPTARVTRTLGWRQVDDRRLFMWGDTPLSADGAQSGILSVDPDGAGERQMLEAFARGGTWEGWRDVVFKTAMTFPRIRLGVYAALSAPLLTLVSAPGFVLHYGNATTGGKTTAAQVAASAVGYPGGPQLSARYGLIQQWDGTVVGGERTLAFLRNLPAFFDDTHRADPKAVAQTVYAVVNGMGRRRGALRGSQRIATWHLCLISTGETTLTETTKMGGIQVRGIDLWGDALETDHPDYGSKIKRGQAAQQLRAAAGEHYGHALPRFVQALMAKPAEEVADLYMKAHQDVVDRIGPDRLGDLGGRLAGAFAALLTSAEIFHRHEGPASWLAEVTYDELADFIAGEFAGVIAANAPRHTDEAAYEAVMSWAAASRAAFYGGDPDAKPPHSGWLGVWNVSIRSRPGDSFIAFETNRLREFLSKHGFPTDAVLRAWRDRGWLVPEADDRLARLVRYDSNNRSRAYVLQRLPELVADPDDGDEWLDDMAADGIADDEIRF